MTAFLIVSALWMVLLLGGWLLVGRTLGRCVRAVDEASGSPVQGRAASQYAAPVRPSAASTTSSHLS